MLVYGSNSLVLTTTTTNCRIFCIHDSVPRVTAERWRDVREWFSVLSCWASYASKRPWIKVQWNKQEMTSAEYFEPHNFMLILFSAFGAWHAWFRSISEPGIKFGRGRHKLHVPKYQTLAYLNPSSVDLPGPSGASAGGTHSLKEACTLWIIEHKTSSGVEPAPSCNPLGAKVDAEP